MAKTRIPYKDWTQAQKDEYKRRYPSPRKHNPGLVHRYNLSHRHGISVERYKELQAAQNNKCAICKRREKAKSTSARGGLKRLSVDHNHKTDRVRGLLCVACNNGLGHFNDNIPRMQAAIAYLVAHA